MKRHGHNLKDRRRAGRGVLSLELALTLPILMVLLMGLFEFSMLFYGRGAVVQASRAGARKATMPGATREDVEQAILNELPARLAAGMRFEADMDGNTGDLVSVAVRVPMNRISPDLLWPIGFGLDGRYLSTETRMARE